MTVTIDGRAAPEGRLVYRAPDQLRPHPVYMDVCGPMATRKTPHSSAGPTPVIAPLLTTKDGLILDGDERWAVARHQQRRTLACIEYDLTDEAALLFMLDQHRRADRLNAFGRIVMALALEPHWRAQARQRQRQGGTEKLSSTLTKAGAIDVRAELARAAGVGAGNVTKVKQLLETATPGSTGSPAPGRDLDPSGVAVAPVGAGPAGRTARPIPVSQGPPPHHPAPASQTQRRTGQGPYDRTVRCTAGRSRLGRISARHAARGRSARTRAYRDP